MQAPMGTANEILQVDAGWSRIETIVAARKVKMAKRVMNKEPGAIVRRLLTKANIQKTEWTREVERLMKDKIERMGGHKWGRVNEIVKRLKHQDLMSQLDRLETECEKTAGEYVKEIRQQHICIKPRTQDYLLYNGHRNKEIQMITKLRARASPLRADLEIRHLLPTNQSPE